MHTLTYTNRMDGTNYDTRSERSRTSFSHTYTHTNTHTYIHTYIHTYLACIRIWYIHTHAYTYIHKQNGWHQLRHTQ
jgi:hypothetical protein